MNLIVIVFFIHSKIRGCPGITVSMCPSVCLCVHVSMCPCVWDLSRHA